jgi:hypothetical protein
MDNPHENKEDPGLEEVLDGVVDLEEYAKLGSARRCPRATASA